MGVYKLRTMKVNPWPFKGPASQGQQALPSTHALLILIYTPSSPFFQGGGGGEKALVAVP